MKKGPKVAAQAAPLGPLSAARRADLSAALRGGRVDAAEAERETGYCDHWRSSDITCCGSWLACATIALPACCRIWARDRLADSAA
jgi:hypothetical protein